MTKLYDSAGREYRTVEVQDEKVLVCRLLVDPDDGASYDADLLILDDDELREEPPKAKVDAVIAKLDKICESLGDEIRVRRQELDEFEKDADGRMARLKQHRGLQRLDDFLAGGITHYVMADYGPPSILALEDAKNSTSLDRDGLKLLGLLGKTNGDLAWRLNSYSDGCGTWTTVIPCTSRANAVEAAADLFEKHVAKALDPRSATKPDRRWIDGAAKCGFVMPCPYVERVLAQEAEAKQAKIDKLKAELKELGALDKPAGSV